jgi:hypothetical protein
MKSKKAMEFALTFSVMWLIYLVLMLVVIVTLINFLLMVDLNIAQTETEVMVNNFIYSYNGFSYKNEELQRNYPNYIDINKFDEKNIGKFEAGQQHLAARFILKDIKQGTSKTVYYNKEWFDKWYGLAITGLPGPGGATKTTKSLPVIITDSKNAYEKQGMLIIEVVTPNS